MQIKQRVNSMSITDNFHRQTDRLLEPKLIVFDDLYLVVDVLLRPGLTQH